MNADLTVQPGKACKAFIDYVSRKDTGNDRHWSSQIKKFRHAFGDTKTVRKQLGDPKSVKGEVTVQRTPIGPAWRTQDGGALVACTGEKKLTVDMGPGQWTEMRMPGWDNTGNTRWNTFTQTTMLMTVLKVPADGSPISIAGDTTWPYKFKGTEYAGG
ncbi:hypothetical protein [Streptomyces sp. 3N207]|uniref:hypothetical protein n=1 Tax=Streptomyces sp. 3N207 TaxID=3457417 RepID=UPI003FD40E8A